MPLLSTNDTEAELSYAYLHAVAAKAGMNCMYANRHLDNAGVDAEINAVERFSVDSVLTDFSLHVQLKATDFMKDVGRYDKLRNSGTMPPRILVVLFLPENAADWLVHSESELAMKRCAYWVSLRGAPETTNKTGVTVYVPKTQPFSPEGLVALMTRISRQEELLYES